MLTLNALLTAADISPRDVLAIRHTFVELHDDGNPVLSPHSTNEDILNYTATQSSDAQKFPRNPPRFWAVFIKDHGRAARFHAIYQNRGVLTDNGTLRHFDLRLTNLLADYKDRLVIDWAAPIRWHVSGESASKYRILEITQQRQLAFPGYYNFVLDYPTLQAVTTRARYEQWRTALASIKAIYLIADAHDGKLYIGKADGAEGLLQRWTAYAHTGHGGNTELRHRHSATFRFSILQVFDPTTPAYLINEAESHYKRALLTQGFGLNRN